MPRPATAFSREPARPGPALPRSRRRTRDMRRGGYAPDPTRPRRGGPRPPRARPFRADFRLPRPTAPPNPLFFVGGAVVGAALWYMRQPDGVPIPYEPGGQWVLRHGPNVYGPGTPYDLNNPTVQWRLATLLSSPIGPQTAMQTNQAISDGARKPIGSPFDGTRQSYWIENSLRDNSVVRFAQYMAFQKLANPRESYSQVQQDQWNSADARHPRATPAPNAMANPPRHPMPDPATMLPQVAYPIPRMPPYPQPETVVPTTPDFVPDVTVPPVVPTEPTVSPQPDSPVPPNFRPDYHVFQPPGPGVKERKGRLRKGFDRLMDIFGDVTEIADIVDSAWGALPDRCKTKTYYKGRVVTSAQDRWADVYRCAGHMDIDQFIRNLINNHVEDWVIGTQNRLRNKVIPDGVDGIDVFRWVDRLLFDGELSKRTDLSKFLPEI